MNKFIIPLVLIVLGVLVIAAGQRRSESIAGASDAMGVKLANAWDGKVRQPEHVWYYVGGGALIFVGIGLATRKKSGT